MKKKFALAFMLIILACNIGYAKRPVEITTSCGITAYIDMDRCHSVEEFNEMVILMDQTLCPENWGIENF